MLPDDDFAMSWEADPKSAKRLPRWPSRGQGGRPLILATDPDREGEAISWHVLEVLKQKRVLKDKPVERVVFNAITKQAVLDAMENPRADRRGAGRRLSGAARPRLSGRLHALAGALAQASGRPLGRPRPVGGPAPRLRPRERDRGVQARRNTGRSRPSWRRRGRRIQRPPRRLRRQANRSVSTSAPRAEAKAIQASWMRRVRGRDVESKPAKRNPVRAVHHLDPAAGRQPPSLGFSANRTMQIAQRLYEGIDIGGETVGLITYMRTDGVHIAPEAIGFGPQRISRPTSAPTSAGGPASLPDQGQERPGSARGHPSDRLSRTPDRACRALLDDDQRRLYELIWKRTIASQMASAIVERTTVDIRPWPGASDAARLRSGHPL